MSSKSGFEGLGSFYEGFSKRKPSTKFDLMEVLSKSEGLPLHEIQQKVDMNQTTFDEAIAKLAESDFIRLVQRGGQQVVSLPPPGTPPP